MRLENFVQAITQPKQQYSIAHPPSFSTPVHVPTHVWPTVSKSLCLSSVPHDACIPVTLSAALAYPCALWCSSSVCASALSQHLETNPIGRKTELLTGGPQIP